MAHTFRYRYVDLGTVFTGDARRRDPDSGGDSPATLFVNELACDVGGSCWGANQPLAILDHQLSRAAQLPSASAAVLHKAGLIRARFAPLDDVVWLVTHKEPDFDAFCSMYLARWLIAEPDLAIDWQNYGLHPDGWLDLPNGNKIDWFDPDLRGIPPEDRWPLLLAGHASRLVMRRQIACPRQRRLRSVLYAAIKRGRDYQNESSGATEFFDEVRDILIRKQLNPSFESVLEGNANFAPELAMLDREAAAYTRDLVRARKALVYLPEAEAPTPDFFQHPRPAAGEISPASLLLADSFRIPTDGIYLRDPECTLFKEWARLDVENSALGAGFEFTAVADSRGGPEQAANTTAYEFAIDPERANGRHLYTVWSRLQTEEVEALRAHKEAAARGSARQDEAAGQGAATLQALLSDPWSGGESRSSTRVDTPRHGTMIAPAGGRGDLRDDPVAEAVRTELEAPLYTPASLVAGPQIAVHDFAASHANEDAEPRQFEFNAPLRMPPPEKDDFRFASVGLRPDAPLVADGAAGSRIAQQIGETLWHTLYPQQRGNIPQDFASHMMVRGDGVGVWSERGIAVARKPRPGSSALADEELQEFAALVSLVRDIDHLGAEWRLAETQAQRHQGDGSRTARSGRQQMLAEGKELARRALEVQHSLSLPDRELLRHFSEAIGFEGLAARLRELNQAVGEQQVHSGAMSEEARRSDKGADDVAWLRRSMAWLEVLILGFVALKVVSVVVTYVSLSSGEQETLALFGGPVVVAIAAGWLQPWRMKRRVPRDESRGLKWVLILAALVWLAAWVAQVFRVW